MELPLQLFDQMTDAVFKTAARYFNADARKAYYSRWQDYCANGAQRLFDSGDIKAANNMYSAAVICGFLPQFTRAVAPFIPFAYKRSEGFSGKIQGPKRTILQTLNAEGIPNWEAEMRIEFDEENAPKVTTAFVLRKRLDAVIKKERAQDDTVHTDTEIRKLLNELLKDYPVVTPDSTVLSGEAQELVTQARDKANGEVAATA